MVYDFGNLTESSYASMCESTRSCSSSEAEFEIEDRPALLRGKKRVDTLSVSLRGRPRSTRIDPLSTSLRDRPRSTSATRRFTTAIAKMKEKNKTDNNVVDVGVELLDDHDDDIEPTEGGDRKRSIEPQDSSRLKAGNEIDIIRPAVLRAPSISVFENLPTTKSVATMQQRTNDKMSICRKIESSPLTPKRIWPQRNAKPSTENIINDSDVPSSPLAKNLSPKKSPPKSPRRLWAKSFDVTNANLPSIDNLASETIASPSEETPRHSSPMKAFGQRAIGSILRSRKKTIDNNSDPQLAVPEDLIKLPTDNNHTPPLSPTKRAIAGILRVCSLHDRSLPIQKSSAHDGKKSTHEKHPSQLHSSNHDNECKNKYDNYDKSSEPVTVDELQKIETPISSTSERGTRSSTRLIDEENELNYSRAVISLVSPRQKVKRKLRHPTSTRKSSHGEKNHVSRPRQRSDSTSGRTRTRSRSIGGSSLSTSSHKLRSRQSNDNSAVSIGEETSHKKDNEPRIRTRSHSRSRKLSSHSDSNDNVETSKSPSSATSHTDDSKTQEGRKVLTSRSSSHRSVSSSCVEDPTTPRVNKPGVTVNGEKRVSRASSHRNVSDTQILLSDVNNTPQSSRSRTHSDGRKSATRTTSRRSVSDAQLSTVDAPKTPRSIRSRDNADGMKSVQRSSSERKVSASHASITDEPKTPRSRKSGSVISHRVAHRSSSSRSVSSASGGINGTQRSRSSRKIAEAEVEIEVLPRDQPKMRSSSRMSSAGRDEQRNSNKNTKRPSNSSSSRPSRHESKSPRRKRVEEEERQNCRRQVGAAAESKPKNDIEAHALHAHRISKKQNNAGDDHPVLHATSLNSETKQVRGNRTITPGRKKVAVELSKPLEPVKYNEVDHVTLSGQ